MKILNVNDFNEPIGGTEYYVAGIMDEFIKLGHETLLFTGTSSHEISTMPKSLGRLMQLFFSFKHFRRAKEIMNKFQPDIIIVNNFFYELSPSFLLAMAECPVIMIVHDNQLYAPVANTASQTEKKCKASICDGCPNCVGYLKTPFEVLKRKFHKHLYKRINMFIGNSTFVNEMTKRANLGPVLNMKYGIRLFKPAPITNYFNITYVGRLAEEKGIRYLIEAFPKIKHHFPAATLTIVGSGELEYELKTLALNLNISSSVDFVGNCLRTNLSHHYTNSTLVCVPSTWDEPFCSVGIEAMSVGRPVIASKVGGIPDWLVDGETGFLVESGNPENIADKTISLLSDRKLLNIMSGNAIKKASYFSLENHALNLERVCFDLLKR